MHRDSTGADVGNYAVHAACHPLHLGIASTAAGALLARHDLVQQATHGHDTELRCLLQSDSRDLDALLLRGRAYMYLGGQPAGRQQPW
jgi:hypothetical protein